MFVLLMSAPFTYNNAILLHVVTISGRKYYIIHISLQFIQLRICDKYGVRTVCLTGQTELLVASKLGHAHVCALYSFAYAALVITMFMLNGLYMWNMMHVTHPTARLL